MTQEPMCLSYSRSNEPEEDGKYHTRRHLSEVVNCLCVGRRDTNEILIIEPQKKMTSEPTMLTPCNFNGDTEYKQSSVSATLSAQQGTKQTQYVVEPMEEPIIISPFDRKPALPSSECAPTLRSDSHGALPCVLTRQRTEEAKRLRKVNGDADVRFSESKEYTLRTDDMSNTITTVQKDNLLAEPQAIGHYRPEGVTGDIPRGEYELRPKDDGIANTLTSQPGAKDGLVAEPQIIQKVGDRGTDNYSVHDYSNTIPANPMSDRGQMVVEPQIQRVGNIYPSQGQGGQVVSPEGLAPTVCECHGEVTRIAEPQISAHPLSHARENPTPRADVAPTLRATDYKAPQCVYERGEREVAYKEMPNGDIRAFQANSPSKAGVPEMMITNPDNEAPTVTTAHEPKVMEQRPRWRIRKLVPIETYRLMDVEDEDIHKLIDAKDENGKPVLSKSAHYKLAGNSICVCCLYHIFRKLFVDTEPIEPVQLELF